MIVYMLKKVDGGWYKASHGSGYWYWLDQQYATVWSSRLGPSSSMAHVHRRLKRRRQNVPEMKIVPFHLTPVGITIANYPTWQGIYANGELKAEDHHFDIEDVLDVLGISYESVDAKIEDSLPEKLEDLEIRK